MNKIKWIRALGMLGAFTTAAVLALNGQVIEAAGVVAASLSSTNLRGATAE